MRILFVISASLWAFLVGRCIAFGPRLEIFTWVPTFDSDSWYNLSDIPGKIPPKYIKFISLVLTIASVTTLFHNNDFVHCAMAIVLVSENCYVPIFTERVKNSYWTWPLTNAILNTIFVLFLKEPIFSIPISIKIAIHIWLLYIEIKLVKNIVREIQPYSGRHARIV